MLERVERQTVWSGDEAQTSMRTRCITVIVPSMERQVWSSVMGISSLLSFLPGSYREGQIELPPYSPPSYQMPLFRPDRPEGMVEAEFSSMSAYMRTSFPLPLEIVF